MQLTDDKDIKPKVKFYFKRLDHQGLQTALKELNELIEKGYRFTLSNLLDDKPNFRAGWPTFSLTMKGYEVQEVVVVEEHPVEEAIVEADDSSDEGKEPAERKFYGKTVEDLLGDVSRLKTMDDVQLFVLENRLEIPKGKKDISVVKDALIKQINDRK